MIIAQNNNVMNVISNENKNFVFEFSEFEFSELECFRLISHSLMIVFHAMHGHTQNFHEHINMAPINSKNEKQVTKRSKCWMK